MVELDLYILNLLNQFSRKSWTFDSLLYIISNANLFKVFPVIAFLWWLWFKYDDSESRKKIVITFLAGIAALLTARYLAVWLPFRIRPLHNPEITFVLPFGASKYALAHWSSMPSDHATFLSALATGILLVSLKSGILAFLYISFVTLIPRIYFGFHYPLDIFLGATVGVFITLFFNQQKIKEALANPLIELEKRNPATFYVTFVTLSYLAGTMFNDIRKVSEFLFSLI